MMFGFSNVPTHPHATLNINCIVIYFLTLILQVILEKHDSFCYFCCILEIKSITTKKLKKICGKNKTTL